MSRATASTPERDAYLAAWQAFDNDRNRTGIESERLAEAVDAAWNAMLAAGYPPALRAQARL